MKKHFKLGACVLAALLITAGTTVNTVVRASDDDNQTAHYEVSVADNENLAMNKWDWSTDQVGSGTTEFASNGMTMKNFNQGSSVYALYKTNDLDEFKFSMYANLSLTWPSLKGYDTYKFNYSNLYISFLIDTDDPIPANTCPWNGNKAYLSLCFEERFDDASQTENDIVTLYINECWNNSGATRKSLIDTRDVDFNDGEFHWYEIEVENFIDGAKSGKKIVFSFDGEEKFSYNLLDGPRKTESADYAAMDVDFTNLDGYIGFWPSSDFPVGANTEDTDCYVEVQKIKIVNLGDNTTYTQCDAPEFEIEESDWSPNAKYEVGEEIELKLSKVFSYEGDETLNYTVTCNGESIGTIKSGFWLWTPTEVGTYDITIKASVGEKEKIVYATIRTSKSSTPSTSTDSEKGSGCSGSVSFAGLTALLTVLAIGVALNKKTQNRENKR